MVRCPDSQVADLLAGAIQDLVLATTSSGILIWVSPSCEKILGYTQDEMMNHSAREFLYPPDLDATRVEMKAARIGKTSRLFECRYVHKDPNQDPVVLQWTGDWSDQYQLHLFVGRDVTEHRTLLELNNIQASLMSIDEYLKLNRPPPPRMINLFELGLALYSFWAAYALFTPPSNFAAFPEFFELAAKLSTHEQLWGCFVVTAALIKVAGIVMDKYRYRPAAWTRFVGLLMSGVFWTIMGVSTVWGNVDTLFGGAGIIFGPLAFWSAIRVIK